MRVTKIKVLQASSGPRPPSKKTRYKIRKTMEIKNKERQAVENTVRGAILRHVVAKRREMSRIVREGCLW